MVFGIVALSYALGLLAAVLLNQKLRGKGIYRALILVPWIIPPVVSYISWQWMLNDQSGAINLALMRLGLTNPIDPIIWLADPNLAMVSIIIVGSWSRFPFMMITMLAALSAISDDVHEAAALDGANRWQRFRDITFPLILPVSVIATLLQAIWTFNDFALPFVLTGGGPANATTTSGAARLQGGIPAVQHWLRHLTGRHLDGSDARARHGLLAAPVAPGNLPLGGAMSTMTSPAATNLTPVPRTNRRKVKWGDLTLGAVSHLLLGSC